MFKLQTAVSVAIGCLAWVSTGLASDPYRGFDAGRMGDVPSRLDGNPVRLLAPQFELTIQTIQPANYQPPPLPASAPFVRPPVVPAAPLAVPQANPRDVFDGANDPAANPFLNTQPNQPYFARLSRSPDLFGDSLIVIDSQVNTGPGNSPIDADFALGGGARRFKNEQAKAFPTDRAFIYYQHFHNALGFRTSSGQAADRSIDRVTLGFEKTFNEGRSSWELRMPFSGNQGVDLTDFNYSSDGVGNLVVSLKQLLHAEENIAIALGLAASVPTGSNVTGIAGSSNYQFKNEAVHLLPYLGLQLTPDENWFFHAYFQVDTPINGNTISAQAFGGQQSTSVKYRDEALLYLDASLGYWWFRNDSADATVTGLASTIELHYTTSLQDANTIAASNGFSIARTSNRINMLNMTMGVHTELANDWALRGAIVVPLRTGADRFFDTEIQVALVKKFGR